MDYQFPRQLFPTFFNTGPPNEWLKQCCGKWGSYDRVLPQVASAVSPLTSPWEILEIGVVKAEKIYTFKNIKKTRIKYYMSCVELYFLDANWSLIKLEISIKHFEQNIVLAIVYDLYFFFTCYYLKNNKIKLINTSMATCVLWRYTCDWKHWIPRKY